MNAVAGALLALALLASAGLLITRSGSWAETVLAAVVLASALSAIVAAGL